MLKLIECPRDAMQGWPHFIATQKKVDYINVLLKVGFDTIDFGSFVSHSTIPQMADTKEVLSKLDIGNSASKLLAIVANERGATDAVLYDEITYLGFPFSISPTFQLRNTNSTIEQSLKVVETIQNLCEKKCKKLVVYISMGFGNPYGDKFTEDIVIYWVDKIAGLDIEIISIADTVGLATPNQLSKMLSVLIPAYKKIEIGVHLHSSKDNWESKIAAALNAGCKRFDGALKGIGGCPMADDVLVGNIDTELMIPYFEAAGLLNGINKAALINCSKMATELFA